MKLTHLIIAAALFAFSVVSQGAVTLFDLKGTAGSGLLPGNEPSSTGTGSGGEIGAGITFDTVTKQLAINVGWGTANGFSGNMTGVATNQHIHVAATSAFTSTGSVAIGLSTATNTVTGGTINQTFTLNTTQEADLLAGKYYINLHTAANSGGEMRGFLVSVPEPSRALLFILGSALVLGRRHRR